MEIYSAILAGSDVNTDMAIIKIDENNLTEEEFTSIENVEVGEINSGEPWLIAPAG